MRRRIWIPKWMYRWLPVSAVVVGGWGVILSGFSIGLLMLSMLTFGYGAVVLAARICWMWAEA